MKKPLFIFSLFISIFLSSFASQAKDSFSPSDTVFIAHDFCPGEGCHYTYWKSNKLTSVYDSPQSKQIIAQVKMKEWVKGITGNVYTHPTKVQTTYPVSLSFLNHENEAEYAEKRNQTLSLPLNEIVYLLTSWSEGIHIVWYKGNFFSVDPFDLPRCQTPSKTCWGKIIGENNLGKDEWWAKIKLRNGKTGWIKEPGRNFSGVDSLSGFREKPPVKF